VGEELGGDEALPPRLDTGPLNEAIESSSSSPNERREGTWLSSIASPSILFSGEKTSSFVGALNFSLIIENSCCPRAHFKSIYKQINSVELYYHEGECIR
jgi:hypothetical protein